MNVTEAQTDDDRGHTVVLAQHWSGIRTSRYVVAYLRGRTMEMVSYDLAALTPGPGTARAVILRDAAMAAVRARFPEEPMASDMAASLQLAFVWDPEVNLTRSEGADDALSAQWAFVGPAGELSRLMVNAHTGRIWIND